MVSKLGHHNLPISVLRFEIGASFFTKPTSFDSNFSHCHLLVQTLIVIAIWGVQYIVLVLEQKLRFQISL